MKQSTQPISFLLQCLMEQQAIQPITALSADLETLLEQAQAEGFAFLDQMVLEFRSGRNCFDQEGEALFELRIYDQLVGIAGINRELHPMQNSLCNARLRRFYVHPDFRQFGVGRWLLQHIESYAQAYFQGMTLYTDTQVASKFYVACGYQRSHIHPRVSHYKVLG